MNLSKKLKLLSNEMRMDILTWLRDPQVSFPELANHPDANNDLGVCVGVIERKGHLSQSTISQYMSQLEAAGFVIAQKSGKWTHYKRNEQAINDLLQEFSDKLKLN